VLQQLVTLFWQTVMRLLATRLPCPSALGYKLSYGGSINLATSTMILVMIAFCFISTQNGGRNESYFILRSCGEHKSCFVDEFSNR
jgi:hypothetical protein